MAAKSCQNYNDLIKFGLRRLSDQKRRSMGAPARRSRLFSGTASPDFLKAVNEINTSDNV